MISNILNNKIKVRCRNLIKRILVITILVTNIFCYIPIASFAESDDSDERYPALVPTIANEIISKYVSTNISGVSNNSNGGIITTHEEKGDGWDSITEVQYPNGTERIYRNYKQYDNGNSYWNNQYWDGNIKSDGCGPSCVAIVLSGYGYDSNPGDVVNVMQNDIKDGNGKPKRKCFYI